MSPLPKLNAQARKRVEDYIEVLDAMRDDGDDGEEGLTAGDLEVLFALHDRVHGEAKEVETGIDTKGLGLATHIATKRRFFVTPKVGDVQVRFDTGIILTGPNALFETMKLHLEEADPK